MTPQELLNAIAPAAAMGEHRQTGQIPFDVLAQHVRRCVAAARLLAHRHQDDAVEIAIEETGETIGAVPRNCAATSGVERIAAIDARHSHARALGILLAHRRDHLHAASRW